MVIHTSNRTKLCMRSPTDVRNWLQGADDFAITFIAVSSQQEQQANRYISGVKLCDLERLDGCQTATDMCGMLGTTAPRDN